MMKHLQKPYWKPNRKSDLIWFSYGYQNRVFVDFLIGYRKALPIVLIVECRVVISIWRCSPISSKGVSLFMLFALWSSPLNHIPIKYREPIKRTSHLKPIYLSCSWTRWVEEIIGWGSKPYKNHWPFLGIHRIDLELMKKKWKITTYNRVDLKTLEI